MLNKEQAAIAELDAKAPNPIHRIDRLERKKWEIVNWGCLNDVFHCTVARQNRHLVICNCKTAFSPPFSFLAGVSKLFPKLVFALKFTGSVWTFEGRAIFAGGVSTHFQLGDDESRHNDRRQRLALFDKLEEDAVVQARTLIERNGPKDVFFDLCVSGYHIPRRCSIHSICALPDIGEPGSYVLRDFQLDRRRSKTIAPDFFLR